MANRAKPSFPQLNRSHPLTQGLVLNVPLFEGAGISAIELLSNSRGIMSNLPTWVSGGVGNMLSFNGAASSGPYVDVTMPANARNTVQQSYSFFIKRVGDSSASAGRIFTETNLASSGHVFSDNKVNMQFLAQVFATTNGTWSYPLPANGVLTFYVITYDSSSLSNTPSVWANGVLQTASASTQPVGARTFNDSDLIIGNINQTGNVGTRTYNGFISDFCKWNRLLSAEEAIQLSADPFQIYKKKSLLAELSAAIPPVVGGSNLFRTLMGAGA